MTAFADASAVVKLYANEPGARAVRSRPLLVVSAVSRVEVVSAFWRKASTGELDEQHAATLTSAFEADWFAAASTFVVVATAEIVLERAAALVPVHRLRAYDAVQLASAVEARNVASEIDEFLSADVGLSAAARREGFIVPDVVRP